MLKYFYNDYVPPKIQKAIEEAKKFVCTTKDRIVNDATDIGNEILLNLIVAPIKAKDFANGICASVGDNSLEPIFSTLNAITGNDRHFSDIYAPVDEQAFLLGKITGDVISLVVGTIEMAKGVATIANSVVITSGGVLVTSTGVLAPAGVAITAVSVAEAVAGVAEVGVGVSLFAGGLGNLSNDIQNYNSSENTWHRMTTKESDAAANELGFQKTNYRSHGQPVYKKGNKYITPDTDGHNGGVWKMADSVENLGSKSTRMGTYDKNLNRIGD